MTNERKMELIDCPEALTAEEQAFIDKAWDDMTEEEKESDIWVLEWLSPLRWRRDLELSLPTTWE